MVRRREDRFLIGNRAVCNDKSSVRRPGIEDFHIHIAGNTADTVCQKERHQYAFRLDRPVILDLKIPDKCLRFVAAYDLSFPEAVLEVARSTVKVILALILRQLIVHAVDGKSTALDSVRGTSDDRSVTGAGCLIGSNRIKTEYYIVDFSILIEHFQRVDQRAVIDNGEALSVRSCNHIFIDGSSVFCRIKKYFFRCHKGHLTVRFYTANIIAYFPLESQL